jgi:SPP1 gp7 family putative phage head morphogenesis protein
LLEDIKDLLGKEIESGKGLDEFLNNLNQLTQGKGWTPKGNQARAIYDTNTRRAHAAGRWQQQTQPEMLERNPYVIWRHRTPDPEFGGQPRLEHKALDGKVFALEEMRQKKVYPPCAWGCRCTCFSISERQLKAMGLSVSKLPDPKTIVDKGFEFIPGSDQEGQAIVKQKLVNLSPEIRKKVKLSGLS